MYICLTIRRYWKICLIYSIADDSNDGPTYVWGYNLDQLKSYWVSGRHISGCTVHCAL